MSGDDDRTQGARVRRADRDDLSRTLGALADPTRRAMLEQLMAGPASVSELAAPMPMSLAAVSKHLAVLEDAGLVTRGRAAQYRPARLEVEPFTDVVDWIARILAVPRAADGPTLIVRRILPHPPARVWSAWTEPERFARWFGTEAVEVPLESVVLQARAGGALRARMVLPGGTMKDWEGEFVDVVELEELDDGSTLLSLQQATDGFDADSVAALEAGYGAFFDAMDRGLALSPGS